MTIETGVENPGVYIDTLDDSYPATTDDIVEGDNHIRGIKNTLLNTFPSITGAVTSTHTELNLLDGATVTTTEINYNDITTLGTVEASKTVTANASGHITQDTSAASKYIQFNNGSVNNVLFGNVSGSFGLYDLTNARDIYTYTPTINTAQVDPVLRALGNIKTNQITADTTDGDLNLARNGTGDITVDSVPIYGKVTLDEPESLVSITNTTDVNWTTFDMSAGGTEAQAAAAAGAKKAILKLSSSLISTATSNTGNLGKEVFIGKSGYSGAPTQNQLSEQHLTLRKENTGLYPVTDYDIDTIEVNLDSNSDFQYAIDFSANTLTVNFSTTTIYLAGYYT